MSEGGEREMNRKQKGMIALGLFLLLAGLFGTALRGWTKNARAQDIAGTPLQEDTALLETLTDAHETLGGGIPKPGAGIRFRGSYYTCKNVLSAESLKLGTTVHITYRIGKSGKIYIESVAP
jgi:hypothetical protein